MAEVFMRIQQNGYMYGKYVVTCDSLRKYDDILEILSDGMLYGLKAKLRRRIKASIDGVCLHYLLREIRCCPNYRRQYVDACGRVSNRIVFELIEPKQQIIDYNWNNRITYLVRERAELEHALSWLSTLGGAFSALGDYFENFALVAGKISYNQLLLAVRMGDPTVASRCRLYYSLSLIQRQRYGLAKRIVRQEYFAAKRAVVIDNRLVQMCMGIWSKLQYEHKLARDGGSLPKITWKPTKTL